MPGWARYPKYLPTQGFSCVFGWKKRPVKCRATALDTKSPKTVCQDNETGSGLKRAAQHLDVFGDLPILNAQLLDPADAVHDRGVIAPAKPAPDLGQ